MRLFLHIVSVALLLSSSAIADNLLLSRGAKIHVLDTPNEATDLDDIDEIESATSAYLLPGTMAIQVTDRNLQNPDPNYKLLLSEAGVWGLFKTNQRDFYDHKWLAALKGWADDMADKDNSNCPKPEDEDVMVLIFPIVTTQAERMANTTTQAFQSYPGDVFYNFRYDRRGNEVTGYLPKPLAGFCEEVQLLREDVNLVSISEGESGWFDPCTDGLDLSGVCIGETFKRIRANYFKNMRIPKGGNEERYSCPVQDTISFQKEDAEKLVQSLTTSLEAQAHLAKIQLEGKVEFEELAKTIVNQTRTYPERFEILRNFYLVADGSGIEILEVWTECPEENGQILPPRGNEPKVYHYYSQGHARIPLGKTISDELEIEIRESTGHWLVRSAREIKTIRTYLTEVHRLDYDEVDFLMTRVFLWQN